MGFQMKHSILLSLLVVFVLTLATAAAAPSPQGQSDAQSAQVVTKVNPKDGLAYLWIPPGKFMMGCSPGDAACDEDEKPPREVTIAKGFWIGQTLVTQGAYKRVTGENPSFFHGSDQLPVENVNLVDVHEYCSQVGMRMLSEAEWEYAARANNPASRYADDLDAIAWYKGNSNGRTHEVANKKPNAWQLYDMLGNLWEWMSDPLKPGDPSSVVQRGGSWNTRAQGIRVSNRGLGAGGAEHNYSGFRCAGDADAPENKNP
jgi:formylglycine-generating enzyme required for sulfatase activity